MREYSRYVASLAFVFAVAACSDDGPATPDGGDPPIDAGLDAELDAPPDAAPCPPPRVPDPDPAREAYLQWAESFIATNNIPGAAIAVVDAQGAVEQRFYVGVTGPGSCKRVDESTKFLFGGMAELATAAAALSADEDCPGGNCAFDVDAPITSMVPFLRITGGNAAAVTSAHLLSHTAGYPSHVEELCWPDGNDAVALSTWFDEDPGRPLWFAPNAASVFSPRGTSLAGLALELTDPASRSFAQIVTDRVFTPLGMTGMTFDVAGADHAVGYGGGPITQQACPYARPMMQMFGTLDDATKLARLLAVGDTDVVSQNARPRLWSGYRSPVGVEGGLALYQLVIAPNDRRARVKTTGWHGFYSSIGVEAQSNKSIVAFANREGNWDGLILETIDRFIDPTLDETPPPATTVPVAQWGAYNGTYADPYGTGGGARSFRVHLEGMQLRLDITTGTTTIADVVLSPTALADVFTLTLANETLTVHLWRDSNGTPNIISSNDWNFGPAAIRQTP